MRFISLLILAALAVLAGCGPAAESVSYRLPATPGGRMCAHQCVEAQDYCLQSCDFKQRACVTDVQTKAMADYDTYTRAQFFNHEPIALNPSDFERQAPCTNIRKDCTAACDKPYQSCYTSCGGQVDTTSSCQFFCF